MAINEKYYKSIVETIVTMYQSGITVSSIVEEIEGVTARDVREVLRESGILEGPGRKPTLVDQIDEATLEALLKDYYDWMPIPEIVVKYKLRSTQQFYEIRRQLGQPARQYNAEHISAKADRYDRAIELYKAGMPIWQIKEETGIQQVRLHEELHRRRIPFRRRDR